jgi:hypothetical protein
LNLLREELEIIITHVESQISVLQMFSKDEQIEDSETVYSYERPHRRYAFLERVSAHQPGITNQTSLILLRRLSSELESKREIYRELQDQVTGMEKQVCFRPGSVGCRIV